MDEAVKIATSCLKVARLVADEPELALMQARKTAETICRAIYEREVGTAGRMMYDELARKLAERTILPKHVQLPLGTIQAFGNFATHAQGGIEELKAEDVVPCVEALRLVARWYYLEYLHQIIPAEVSQWCMGHPSESPAAIPLQHSHILDTDHRSRYRVATMYDVHQIGYDTTRFVDELLKMDYDTLAGLDEHHAGKLDQWVPVVENNPDGMRVLLDDKNAVVGYWHFVALSPAMFEKAMKGQLYDEEITVSSMRILGLPGVYQAYVVCISIQREHRGYTTMKLMFDAFVLTLAELAESDMYFSDMSACAFTPEGVALCESAGFQKIANHCDHGEIYWADMKLPPAPMRRNARLSRLYRDFFSAKDEVPVDRGGRQEGAQ